MSEPDAPRPEPTYTAIGNMTSLDSIVIVCNGTPRHRARVTLDADGSTRFCFPCTAKDHP